ncbi:2-succinylbenzoate--CoA ligase [Paraburkholderia sediminicola]|uniref:2-succinylbenzoate--CoA ligase n=2 Tax=Paraburkholderia sediminicola TaxID=458836 RepID=A0A6J5CYT3_9BURK|nr:2-succinylbenzoate--CoA ligase [Paraburkholderia sediminicola]
MSLHQLLSRASQAVPRRIALQHEGKDVTWEDFRSRVARRASQMSIFGERGDRIAILSANVPEYLEALFAVPWAGMVMVPLNTRLSLEELKAILEHCQCRHLYYDERNSERGEQLARAIEGLSASRLIPISGWGEERDDLNSENELPFIPCAPYSPAAIFCTGGTTGRPKGVEHSHVALLMQALIAKDLRLDENTVYLHTVPLFHLAGFVAAICATAVNGRHKFLPESSPAAVLDKIEHEGVNVVNLVPTMIAGLLDVAKTRTGALRRLKTILYGASPIAEPLLLRLLHDAPGVGLVQIYGQTEVGACTVLPASYHTLEGSCAGKLGSAGRPLAAFLVRVADDNGLALPNGEAGEVQICGPGIMSSYWEEPELTRSTIQNGWLRTGDLGVLDDDGFLTIVGRLKDMIITGGENVFAGEVESALMYHEAVGSAAVFGVPDPKWGEAVHAAVVLKPGYSVTAAELITHCRDRIAHYKCPRSIAIRDTPLPLSGVGKVRKVDLLSEWKEQNKQ